MEKKRYIYFITLLLSALFVSCQGNTLYHVGKYGDQRMEADGSEKHPFPDLESAIQLVRNLRQEKGIKPVEIRVHQGIYYFERGIRLDSLMSDIHITACPGDTVIFSGGRELNVQDIQQCELGNGQRVCMLDLKACGITDYGTIKSYGFSRPWCNSWMELFVDGRPMYLAQWPNKEEVRLALGKIIDGGSAPRYGDFSNRDAVMEYDSARISGWAPTDDQWIYGCFNVGWAEDGLRIKKLDKEKKRITTDGPTLYGFKSGRPWNTWYAFNIREEVDQPGEYYLDRKTGRLFFIPYSEQLQSVTVSMLEEPFFDIRHCSKVEVKHIIFEYSRAALVSLWNTEQVKLAHCTFRNAGDVGVIVGLGIEPFKGNRHEGIGRPVCGTLGNLQQHLYADQVFNREGGHDNVIDHCQFYQLAAGGVSLGGGNRLTLEHGNNVVSHCIFHDNNRLAKSYRPAVHITGVGNKVVNCEIANTPSMAILLAGNDHLIEGNYIHDACQEVEDQGAFYYGRNPSECGNVVRRNLFANITQDFGTSSVYIDDGACGLTVEENVFYRGGKQCILLGGGSDNHISRNVFINGNMGVYLDKRLQNWAKDMIAPGGIFEKRLKEVNYLQEPYLSAYPFMKDYWPQDGMPKRNVFTDNVFIGLNKKANHPELGIWKEDDIRPEQLVLPEGFSIEKLLEDLRRKGTKGIWPVIGPRLL